MTRDHALRVDGMVRGAMGHLDAIANYLRKNFPPEDAKPSILVVGTAMAELMELSSYLYKAHPDIVPDDMKP